MYLAYFELLKRKIEAKFNHGSCFLVFSVFKRTCPNPAILTGYPQKLVHVIVSSCGLTKTSRRACTICDMNSQAGSINFHCRDCGIWLCGIPNLFANKRCIFIPWPLWRVGDAPFLGCIYSIYITAGCVCLRASAAPARFRMRICVRRKFEQATS